VIQGNSISNDKYEQFGTKASTCNDTIKVKNIQSWRENSYGQKILFLGMRYVCKREI